VPEAEKVKLNSFKKGLGDVSTNANAEVLTGLMVAVFKSILAQSVVEQFTLLTVKQTVCIPGKKY
jgi:hypothetical protein